jgi:hypothetical protein
MKKKIIGVLICILLIATAVPAAESLKNNAIVSTVPNALQTSMSANWTEIQKLIASDGAADDSFGISVSLDGDTALIGAPSDDDNGHNSGSAYVFTRTGTTWTQQQKLLASDGAEWDMFGRLVSLDGETALIAAEEDDDNGASSGSVYVFTRTGTTWTQQQKLLASDGEAGDEFGTSVSLDGDTALIGAWGDDDYGDGSGSAYVFTRTGTTWTQQQKLLPSDGAEQARFGFSVSLSGDTALIAAYHDETYQGSAYVFTRTGTTWTQQAKLLASDGTSGDEFGVFVSLDGDTALIGAPGDDNNGNYTGSAYVFTRTGTTWTQQQKLLASDGEAEDEFGISVSLDGDTALIGAYLDGDNGVDSGSAYVFTRTGTTWTQQVKLLASDGAAGDLFSYSVFLDGDTALIAAWGDESYKGSTYVFTKESENQPPFADFSWTPQNPRPNQQITFDASASHDPDGAITLYEWDWDNNGIYEESHPTPTATHSWANIGSYPVTVRVTDNEDATGTLSKTIDVSGTVNFSIDITGGFGATAVITNTGTINATNIQWTFTLTGGLILSGKIKSGTSLPLRPGAIVTIKVKPIIGFGKTTIKVDVTCAEGASATQTKTGIVILFFVLGVK